jgi:hypothetical protein
MSDFSIVPGQNYVATPVAPNTYRTRVAANDPTTVGGGAVVSIDPGQPVTPSGGADGTTIFLANATGGATAVDKAAANVLGLAVSAGESPGAAAYFAGPGPLTLQFSAWENVGVGENGLTTGAEYYLGLTPGTITTTEPTDDNNFATPIGFAVSPNTMWVQIGPAVGPLT